MINTCPARYGKAIIIVNIAGNMSSDEFEIQEKEEFRIPHGNFRTLFDYKTVIEMHNDGCDAEEISNFVEASPNMIFRFVNEYHSYDGEISNQWVEIMYRLWELECERGSIPQDDYVLKLLRSNFNDYIFNPNLQDKPTISDVNWAYGKLIERERIENNRFVPVAIDGTNESFEEQNRDWVQFFSEHEQNVENNFIQISWNGDSIGGFVEWLNEFLFRGWKLYELKSDLESDELHATFKK
jgi:hypothetical protein